MVIKKERPSVSPYEAPSYASILDHGNDQRIKLALSESLYPLPEFLLDKIQLSLSRVNYYPDGNCGDLREILSDRLGVFPDDLFIGNGSDEVLFLIATAFIQKGGHVVLSDKSFAGYSFCSWALGCHISKIPLNGFSCDLTKMLEAVNEKTNILFLCNPHNPTGTYIDSDTLIRFLDEAFKKNPKIVICLDQAYIDFIRHAEIFTDYGQLSQIYPNLIVVRTFSKFYGLAGLRIGYCVGNRGVIKRIRLFKNCFPYSVNSLAQIAATEVLRHSKFYEERLYLFERDRDYFYSVLADTGLRFIPSQVNFCMIYVGDKLNNVIKLCYDNKIIIRELEGVGFPGWVRVTLGPPSIMRKLISLITSVL